MAARSGTVALYFVPTPPLVAKESGKRLLKAKVAGSQLQLIPKIAMGPRDDAYFEAGSTLALDAYRRNLSSIFIEKGRIIDTYA